MDTLAKNKVRASLYAILFISAFLFGFWQLLFLASHEKEIYGQLVGSAVGTAGAALVAVFSVYASSRIENAVKDRKAYGRGQALLNNALTSISFAERRMRDFEALAKKGILTIVYLDKVELNLDPELAADFLKDEVANLWTSILGEFKRAADSANTFLKINEKIVELFNGGKIQNQALTEEMGRMLANLQPVYGHFDMLAKKSAELFAMASLMSETESSILFLFFPNKSLTKDQRKKYGPLLKIAIAKMYEHADQNARDLRNAGVIGSEDE